MSLKEDEGRYLALPNPKRHVAMQRKTAKGKIAKAWPDLERLIYVLVAREG
jgi:hypothetical protein